MKRSILCIAAFSLVWVGGIAPTRLLAQVADDAPAIDEAKLALWTELLRRAEAVLRESSANDVTVIETWFSVANAWQALDCPEAAALAMERGWQGWDAYENDLLEAGGNLLSREHTAHRAYMWGARYAVHLMRQGETEAALEVVDEIDLDELSVTALARGAYADVTRIGLLSLVGRPQEAQALLEAREDDPVSIAQTIIGVTVWSGYAAERDGSWLASFGWLEEWVSASLADAEPEAKEAWALAYRAVMAWRISAGEWEGVDPESLEFPEALLLLRYQAAAGQEDLLSAAERLVERLPELPVARPTYGRHRYEVRLEQAGFGRDVILCQFDGRLGLARAIMELGLPAQAEEVLAAVSRDGLSGKQLCWLAVAYSDVGDLDAAADCLALAEEVLDAPVEDPDDRRDYVSLAEAMIETGEVAFLQDVALKIHAINGRSPVFRLDEVVTVLYQAGLAADAHTLLADDVSASGLFRAASALLRDAVEADDVDEVEFLLEEVLRCEALSPPEVPTVAACLAWLGDDLVFDWFDALPAELQVRAISGFARAVTYEVNAGTPLQREAFRGRLLIIRDVRRLED